MILISFSKSFFKLLTGSVVITVSLSLLQFSSHTTYFVYTFPREMSFFMLRMAQAFLSCTADVWRSFDFSRSKKPDRSTRVPCQTWRLDTPEIACVEQHFFIRHENIILHLAFLEESCLWKQHKNTNLNSQLHRFIKVVQGMTWVFRCSFMNLASGQVKGHLFEAKCQMIPTISGVARLHQEEMQQRSVERSGSRPENVQKLMSHLESSWHVLS